MQRGIAERMTSTLTRSDPPVRGLDNPPNRLPALDGLRAVAALAVVLFHYGWRTWPDLRAHEHRDFAHAAFQQLGRDGVFLFFVLSGFLVGGPFVRWACGLGARPAIRRYVVARASRILPLWWAVLAFVLVVEQPSQVRGVRDILLLATLQQNYDPDLVRAVVRPAWTLVVEVSFYAALPLAAVLVARAVRTRAGSWSVGVRQLLTAGALTGVVVATAHLRSERFGDAYWQVRHATPQTWTLETFADMFAAGMLVALIATRARPGRHVAAAAAASSAVAYFSAIHWREELAGLQPTMMAGAAALLLTAVVLAPRSSQLPVLTAAPLGSLGAASYALYLCHMPVAHLLHDRGVLGVHHSPVVAVASLLGSVGVAVAISFAAYHYIERPARTRILAAARSVRPRRTRLTGQFTRRLRAPVRLG
jgi:peptidoglycan/LPS O-acetylase OafA/YrhL